MRRRREEVGVLIGGDCLSATTHVSLLLEATEQGVETRIIHGSSIFSAVAETGLSLYKFGRTVTMPFPEKGPADTVLRGIRGKPIRRAYTPSSSSTSTTSRTSTCPPHRQSKA